MKAPGSAAEGFSAKNFTQNLWRSNRSSSRSLDSGSRIPQTGFREEGSPPLGRGRGGDGSARYSVCGIPSSQFQPAAVRRFDEELRFLDQAVDGVRRRILGRVLHRVEEVLGELAAGERI